MAAANGVLTFAVPDVAHTSVVPRLKEMVPGR